MEAEKETMRANPSRAISHDLRTPLTALSEQSSAYLENQENLSEKQNRMCKNIYEDSNWFFKYGGKPAHHHQDTDKQYGYPQNL